MAAASAVSADAVKRWQRGVYELYSIGSVGSADGSVGRPWARQHWPRRQLLQ